MNSGTRTLHLITLLFSPFSLSLLSLKFNHNDLHIHYAFTNGKAFFILLNREPCGVDLEPGSIKIENSNTDNDKSPHGQNFHLSIYVGNPAWTHTHIATC